MVSPGQWGRLVWSIGLSALVTIGILAWLLHHRPASLWALWQQAWAWEPLLAYAAISLAGAVGRTWRYRWLLAGTRVRYSDLFLVTLVRNFTVDLLPARAGSLSYPALLYYRLRVPATATWASFIWAFVWDIAALAVVLWIAWWAVGPRIAHGVWLLILPAGLTMVTGTVILLPARLWRRWLAALAYMRHRWLLRILRRRFPAFSRWIRGLADIGTSGRDRPLRMLGVSLLIRGCKYGSLYVLYAHFVRSLDAHAPALDILSFIWTITAAEATAFLPVQGLFNIGPWEAAWTLATQWVQAHTRDVLGVLSAFVHWTAQVWEYGLGGIALVWLLTRRNPGQQRNHGGQRPEGEIA